MEGFRVRQGRLVARVGAEEQAVLLMCVDQVRAMLAGEEPSEPWLPGRPTLARVFPTASRTDPEVAAEFAELTLASMRRHKTARLARLAGHLAVGKMVLTREEADDVAAALNDVRLVLAELLGIETAGDSERLYSKLDDGPPTHEGLLGEIYAVLSAVQESLITALISSEGLGRG
ncbi:MAG: DUF2017 domain-containing protein [Bifidobacteriaceae bacterium]|jgi:hypothetical protein|nr:DUF2017 domain-containing protein [Bifidobacteriaceae bacterium]